MDALTRFPERAVPPEALREDEYLGTKFKFWFTAPTDERRALFKRGRPNEDWSEKIAAEIARRLGMPAAEVDLGVHEGTFGIVSPTFLEPGDQLHHGNELLLSVRPDYPQHDRYHVGQHTVEAVLEALEVSGAGPTPGFEVPWAGFAAQEQLVGYLMLDALVGNTDRHHENWAVVQRGTARFLAPTYDHASSLGRNEPARRVALRVEGGDPRVTVASYVEKGRSAFYTEGASARPLGTLDAFLAAARRYPRAARHWMDRLAEIEASAFEGFMARVPARRISGLHRRFGARILEANRERILAVEASLDAA